MGRVSKRKCNSENSNMITIPKKIIKVGIYARLSSDSDERKNESIDVQVEIAKDFIARFNANNVEQMEVFDVYQDLGKTGTNFNRDEFVRLMQDVRLRDVDCVIVKDLSRFGRNYLEAGNYIEKIFPFLGVRFIAVADGYDTGANGSKTDSMATEIKNLVNDMYAKDFSVKARLHLQQRREEGSYVGGPAPYGYECYFENRIRKLKPDPNTAPVVKLIFKLMLQYKNYNAVVDDVNSKKINPPALYREKKETYCRPDVEFHGWDKSSIQRILRNPLYRGHLEQGKTSILGKSETNRMRKDQSEWVMRENTHEPLVDAETYEKVAEIMKAILKENKARTGNANLLIIEENIFDDVLFCGVCGRKMTRHSRVKEYADGEIARVDAYSCLNSSGSKTDSCPESNRITKRALVDIVAEALRLEFAVYLGKPKAYIDYGKQLIETSGLRYDKKIKDLQKEKERLLEEESNTYIAYREGKTTQSVYVEIKLANTEKYSKIAKKIKEAEECKKSLVKVADKFAKSIRALLKVKSGKELTKEVIDSLIEKIYLYPGKRVEIVFQYSDDMLKGVK